MNLSMSSDARRELRGARASRVLAVASRHRELPPAWIAGNTTVFLAATSQEVRFVEDDKTSTRDARAPRRAALRASRSHFTP